MHTKGPWTWLVHDYSGITLHGPDEMFDHVISLGPCESCLEHAKTKGEMGWKWGRCTTPTEADAILIAEAPTMYDQLASARAIMQRFVNKVDDIDKDEMIDVEDICVEMKEWLDD